MTIHLVAKQLQDNCPCFFNTDTSVDELETVAKELINLISLSTCWTTESCETLLKSIRTERITLPCYDCNCCGDFLTFKPYFQYGFEAETVKLSVTSLRGLELRNVEVLSKDFTVMNLKGYTEIRLNLNPYSYACDCNSCEEFYLEVSYVAGYDKLPTCVLSEACLMVSAITASKMGCGGLDECCQIKPEQLGHILKSKKKGELSWTWQTDTESIAYLYKTLINANRFKSLSMISLCGTNVTGDELDLWAYSTR